MIFQSLRHHFHGAYRQKMLSVQFKEIRTLPHPSQFPGAGIQDIGKMPVKSVLAFKKKDRAVSVLCGVSRHRVEFSILAAPDLRIAEIHRASALGKILSRQHRIPLIFFIIGSVAGSDTLCLIMLFFTVFVRHFSNACIHDEMASVVRFQGAAGETARIVIIFIRRHNRRTVFPCNQIPAHGMSPVHGPPFVGIRIVLIKQMIFTFVEGKSIGIIDPSAASCHMVTGPLLRTYLLSLFSFIVSCLL